MLFEFEPAESLESPIEGRLGGTPFLPPGTAWPTADGEAVPFLAQLPLGRAQSELPFSVDDDAMLTIFWNQDWWEAKQADGPLFLIHSSKQLVELQPPAPVATGRLCRLVWQQAVQPDWSDLEATLDKGADDVDSLVEDFLAAADEESAVKSRIGGQGFWVQEAVGDLLAQLVSDSNVDLCFGDHGSLYIVGDDPERLDGFIQSY